MSESDQFADIPPPPPDPSEGANIAAMTLALKEAQGKVELVSQEQRNAGKITPGNNPANDLEDIEAARERMIAERGERMSLNAPDLNLSVPEIPGYHLHWFLEVNLPLGLKGWYEFVRPGEVAIPDKNIGGISPGVQSEDLGGNRVTQINKGPGANGQPVHFVLMKIRQEWYFDEQRKIAERNYSVLQQIFKNKLPIKGPGESMIDYQQRYTREAVLDMSAGRFRPANV